MNKETPGRTNQIDFFPANIDFLFQLTFKENKKEIGLLINDLLVNVRTKTKIDIYVIYERNTVKYHCFIPKKKYPL